jgi:hypothetical protein
MSYAVFSARHVKTACEKWLEHNSNSLLTPPELQAKENIRAVLVLARTAPKGPDAINLSASDAYILQDFL